MQRTPTPLTLGWEAARANAIPALIIQAIMLALLIGSIPGIILGSLLATRSSDTVLRPILAVTLLIVSVRLLAA